MNSTKYETRSKQLEFKIKYYTFVFTNVLLKMPFKGF